MKHVGTAPGRSHARPRAIAGLLLGFSLLSAGPATAARDAATTPVQLRSVEPVAASAGPTLPPGGTYFDDDGRPEEGYLETLTALGAVEGCDPDRPDLVCPDRLLSAEDVQSLVDSTLCAVGTSPTCWQGWTQAPWYDGPLPSDRDDAVVLGYLCPDATAVEACRATVTLGEAALIVARVAGLQPRRPPRRPSVTIAMTGDILLHLRVNDRARATGRDAVAEYDYLPMLERVIDELGQADLALCHLEVPLSPDNTALSGYPRFNAPHEAATALAAVGYEGCSTASNHALDKGFDGLSRTLDVLDDAGLAHTGTARTEQAWATPQLYEVGPAVIAHLSYTYGTNGIPLPRDHPWSVNKIDVDAIVTEAQRARDAGADFVVVSLHWGAEYRITPTSSQQRIARALLETDSVDLLVGHHAHVVQPLGKVGDKYVAYGLGNFLSGQCCTPPNTRDGVIAYFDIALRTPGEWTVRNVSFTPTWVDRYGDYHVYAIPESLSDPDLSDKFKATLGRSLERTTASLGLFGEVVTVREP